VNARLGISHARTRIHSGYDFAGTLPSSRIERERNRRPGRKG